MSNTPWSFDQCVQRSSDASRRQKDSEDAFKQTARDAAQAEEAYRVALSAAIVEQHEQGVAWSVAADVARGLPAVARLRRERDIADGVRDAMSQAGWRRSADRKDVQRFSDYSLRRDLMENGGGGDAEQHLRTIGRAA